VPHPGINRAERRKPARSDYMKGDNRNLAYLVSAFRLFRTKNAAYRLRDRLRNKRITRVRVSKPTLVHSGRYVRVSRFFPNRVAAIAFADELLKTNGMRVSVSKM
jgi:hypothetical protein